MTRSRLDSKALGNFWNLTKSGKNTLSIKMHTLLIFYVVQGISVAYPWLRIHRLDSMKKTNTARQEDPAWGQLIRYQISVTSAEHSRGEDHGNKLTSTKFELLTSFFWLKCLLQNTVDAYLCRSKSKLVVFFFLKCRFLPAIVCRSKLSSKRQAEKPMYPH